MDDFVAYNSPRRLALLFLGVICGLLAGLWMGGVFGEVPSSPRYPYAETLGIGWFLAVFCVLCGIVIIKRCFDPRKQLEIGLSDVRWILWSDDLIPWSEITDVTTWAYNRQRGIVLHLRNPERFQGRGVPKMLAGANRRMTGGDISISLGGTNRSFEEAMAAITRFRI